MSRETTNKIKKGGKYNMYKEKKPEVMTEAELREYRIPQETVFIYTEQPMSIGAYSSPIDWWGCPRCHSVIEHDFQNYCGHCGQRVSWKKYAKLYANK
jgi:hypothetical protein